MKYRYEGQTEEKGSHLGRGCPLGTRKTSQYSDDCKANLRSHTERGTKRNQKEGTPSLADGATESVCETDIEGIEMTESNNSTSDENGVCPTKLPEELSSEHDTNPNAAAVQNKSVSSTQQHTKKALKQALRQQHKRRNGVSMMVNKAVPRVVLTPLKVSDEQPDSPSGIESKNGIGDGEGSDKELKPGQRSPTGKQISQHLKKLKKSGLGHLKWTKAEDIDIETPGSILVNTNLRALINKHTFASLPQHFQQYLLLLLPEVDRQMGSDGVLRLSNSALNNEFFAYAAQGWKQRLAEGEFTPEMQLRIRQEIEKEKKIEPWKEKFYEIYYGEKLGMTEEESMILTSVQECTEDGPSSAAESSCLPGTSSQSPAEKKEPENTEKLQECEESVDEAVCNMELVSKVVTEQATEDILLSGFPDISAEESVVQEEIAVEVDSNICEYLEQDEQEIGPAEYVSSCTPNEAEETPTLQSDNLIECAVESSTQSPEEVNHKVTGNEAEIFTATPQLAPVSVDQTLSPPVDSENYGIQMQPQTTEQQHASDELRTSKEPGTTDDLESTGELVTTEELAITEDLGTTEELAAMEDLTTTEDFATREDLGTTEEHQTTKVLQTTEELSTPEDQQTNEMLTPTVDLQSANELKDHIEMEDPSSDSEKGYIDLSLKCTNQPSSVDQSISRPEPSPEQRETKIQVGPQPEENMQQIQEATISAPSEIPPEELQISPELRISMLEKEDTLLSSTKQVSTSSEPPFSCRNTTIQSPEHQSSLPLLPSVSESPVQEKKAVPQLPVFPELTVILEVPEIGNPEAEQTASSLVAAKPCASSSAGQPSVYCGRYSKKLELPEAKQQHTAEKHDLKAAAFTEAPNSSILKLEDSKPAEPPPEITAAASTLEAVPLPEIPKTENLQLQQNIKEPKQETNNAFVSGKASPETSNNAKGLKQIKHHHSQEKSSSLLLSETTSKSKHHRSHQTNHQHRLEEPHSANHVEPNKSPEIQRTDCRDPEISKRKTGEQHTGICKEKRARIEDKEHQNTSQSSAPPPEKEVPPKEELRVPPLKIQLSKVGLPFIIKTQPVSKPEPKVSSTSGPSTGRNTGARTLADIKARAQQARAQREAAAAAAVAAAARITSGDGGAPSEGSKTRTLAHIKEQTKAKLFAKHQARAHSHQAAKGAKLHSSKEDKCSSDSQVAVQSKSDGPTGVIIANPNRRPLEKGFALSSGSCPTFKASENRIAKSVGNMSVPNAAPHSIPVPQPSCKLPQTGRTNTMPSVENNHANPNTVFNSAVPVSVHGFSISPDNPSVLMAVGRPNHQKSLFQVYPSKPGAKATVSGSTHRAVVPKYNDDSTAPVSTEVPAMPCPLNNASPNHPINGGLRYTGQTTPQVSCVSTALPTSKGSTFQDNTVSKRNCPPRSNTPFLFERPSVPFPSDYHALSNADRRETQHYRQKASMTKYITDRGHVNKSPIKNNPMPTNENVVNEIGTWGECRQLPLTDSASNKAIPCKVIVDHSSGSYSSTPAANLVDARQNLPNKGVKTETVLRLQESIMSRSEPFRQKTEQNSIFNDASRTNSKKLQVTNNALHGSPVLQQNRQKGVTPSEQSAANLIYSSLLYKHVEKVVISDQISEPKSWLKEKDDCMDTMIIHQHVSDVKKKKGKIISSTEGMITSPDCSIFSETIIKSEPSDMDTEDLKEAVNLHHGSHFLDERTVKTSVAATDIAEDCVSLNTENHKRGYLAVSSSCRLSSVEANNPLVTQLLQGNLPLEKVLPQPRSGARLEINRLPLPLQNTSVCKTAAAMRNVMENVQSCLSPDGKGLAPGIGGPVHIRKRDICPNKKVSKSAGELAHIKCEQNNQMTEAESKNASCTLSTYLNQLGPRQPFVQEWVKKSLMHGRITPSPEIKQQKRPLPACIFQKDSLDIDKNGSFPSEASDSQRLFYPPRADVRDTNPPTALLQANMKATSGCTTPNTLAFNRNQEQKGLGEVNISVATDQLRKRSVFSSNLQIKQADDIHSVSQAAQNASLLHPPNGEVPSDQKQTDVAMETKRLSWLPSANICSNIKVEPISFNEGLGNNCEMAVKQTSYQQNEAKEHMQGFQLKSPEFPSYMAPAPHKSFAQLKTPQAPQSQQVYGKYSTIHFGNTNFNRTASVIEKSIGSFLGNSASSGSDLSNQSASVSGQIFADGSSVDELELKCSCRLKAMIVCKGCGAFCHDDCIGPSKLCVACLVVR
ncbi:putative Polycomb group protein ASXL3 isoform X2 [Polyodon spathula]|uniref:putative Polycomb group protein ASXL3 isoform X2 n=1 Tax=Polyodon spathula TaxID=7913 RepID=UPI001B7E316A|nr:putative Polycomb group protein ASXL3 isoform X2 [Polyodon spathula]